MSKDQITYSDFRPVVGQWYLLTHHHDGYALERLVSWVTATGPNRTFSVSPVGQSGYPIDENSVDAEGIPVAGEDRAPDGRTWHEVYNDPPANAHGSKRVDELLKAGSKPRK